VWREGWRGKVYVEIAGFWTADYVKKKAEKVTKARVPLVVIAGEEFGEVKARSAEFDGLEFVVYSRRLDYGEIVRAINRLARKFGLRSEGGKKLAGAEVLEKVRDEIRRSEPKSLEELERILEKYGLSMSDEVLRKTGVRVVWKGLEPEIVFE